MESPDLIHTALNILERDKINNISVINFIKQNQILSIDIIGSSVLVRGISDRRWVYISCKNKEEFLTIKNMLHEDDENFSSLDEWMFPLIVQGKKIVWDLSTVQFYLPEDVHCPSPKYKTVPLAEKDAEIVYNNSDYKKYLSLEYVQDRIQKGISAGLYENDKLVSWAMTQDDGAIGFLHTLDNYRRKEYGECVTLSMIEKLRSIGELPFGYAEMNNEKSINLLLKFGFKENKKIYWFQIS